MATRAAGTTSGRIRIALLIAALIAAPVAGPAVAHGEPFRLDDVQLDSIVGGYVEIGITAEARAAGIDPVAISATRTEVRAGIERGRRYRYTVARAWALAYAAGDDALTSIDAWLDTDEEIVRSRVHAREARDVRLPRRFRAEARALGWRPGQHGTSELRIVRIRVVTRVPAP